MVVESIVGVVKEFPLDNEEPPVGAVYQFIFPSEDSAVKVTFPEPHTDDGVVKLTVGDSLTVAVTAVRVSLVQPFDMAPT